MTGQWSRNSRKVIGQAIVEISVKVRNLTYAACEVSDPVMWRRLQEQVDCMQYAGSNHVHECRRAALHAVQGYHFAQVVGLCISAIFLIRIQVCLYLIVHDVW